MVEDMDLKLIGNKPESIELNSKSYTFKVLSTREHLLSEFEGQEIEKFIAKDKKTLNKLADMIVKYLQTILNITKEEAESLPFEDFQKLRRGLDRLSLYHQGWNNQEIDDMEKKLKAKAMATGMDKAVEEAFKEDI